MMNRLLHLAQEQKIIQKQLLELWLHIIVNARDITLI